MKDICDFILKLLQLGDPVVKIGNKLLYTGVALLGGGVVVQVSHKLFSLDVYVNEAGYWSTITGLFLIALSVAFYMFYVMQRKKDAPYLYYFKGMDNMDPEPPEKFLPSRDRLFMKSTPYPLNSYDKQQLAGLFNTLKYNVEERTESMHASHVYLAGLGSFPLLFLVGVFMRNAYARDLYLMDYDRNKGAWYVLEDGENNDIPIHMYSGRPLDPLVDAKTILQDDPDEVGIALSYTFEIPPEQLPQNVRDHTMILTLSSKHGHDKIMTIAAQKKLLNDISIIINTFGKDRQRKIHLFASAQASFCLALGKNYMPNAHHGVVLHNYAKNDGYDWSVTYDDGEIS